MAALRDVLGNALSQYTDLYVGFKVTGSSFEQILPVYPSPWSVYFSHQQRMEGRAGALQAGAGLATGSALQKATPAKLSNSPLHLDMGASFRHLTG